MADRDDKPSLISRLFDQMKAMMLQAGPASGDMAWGSSSWIDWHRENNPALRVITLRTPPREVEPCGGPRRPKRRRLPPDDVSTERGLTELLMNGLRLVRRLSDEERRAAEVIITNLDDRGFLTLSLDEVAIEADVSLLDAENGQVVVQELEPEGCGTTVQDYLIWAAHHRDDRTLERLITHHFADLHRGYVRRLATAAGITPTEAAEYVRRFKELPPSPVGAVRLPDPPSIRPTVFIRRQGASLEVEVWEPFTTRVVVDQDFEARLLRLPPGPERAEGEEQLRAAREVVDRLGDQPGLLQRIAAAAVHTQRAWLLKPGGTLKRLTMDELAEHLHEEHTNLSRIVRNQHCIFEGKCFPLRKLFVNRTSQDSPTTLLLRAAIRELVDAEDKRAPLSDEGITQAVRSRGIHCVRRTVAVHRSRLGIPPAHQRRTSG